MATAAPTAPAPAAQGPAADAVASPAAPQAGAAPAARSIKPIPPPKLPGVLEDGPEDASSPEAVATRARDASGRFVAGGREGEPTVQKARPSAVEAADGIPEPPVDQPVKPKFSFAGEEYDSQEAAEQSFKSLRGMHKPLQEKAARTEGQLVKAAESARGWHSEAQRLAARVAELESGAATPAPQSQPDAPAQGIDWELFAEISKVANEAGTPWKAQQWLQEQVDAQRAADIARLRDEAIESPRREAEAQAARLQTANTLVESMVAHKNPDGSPTFPEFASDDSRHDVGALWVSLGLDPDLALTPGGAVAAVALYRMARAMDGSPAPAPAAVPTPAPPAPNRAAEAAAALEGGRPMVPNAGDTRHMDPAVARLVTGLKNTQLIRPGLGFEA